ncbi:putative P-loop containing nucleoside triphosphate hydrolase, leucine-rich repeat domain, L [Rosa chinensis]|uniref:Putative P-loop containing nucleoside triphosphate hydrolase, leucine-rich repeat domain, L n=1 Tax=Rosa chinensis TaxID=74649 RepID=A0A2P6RJN9_ROSCH|nr:putative P-loop containing nucleoside triphosphate hydrolase, leucine-rich repeat domain, L [Rosa chinensis]
MSQILSSEGLQFGSKTVMNLFSKTEEIDDPGAKLRLFLQQMRYLVVLDGVWSEQDLYCIIKALPNGPPGSKMIITCRNSSVVLQNHLGNLQPEVEECTDKILQWCRNQPFAISAVGSLLAEKPQTQAEWEDIYNNLGSKTGPGFILEIVSNILQSSFMDILNHLKSCFLYLSIFPPNYTIQHEKLIHLWVAEGLAERYARSLTMEHVAQSYLNELISRNLVLATEREINGQLQSCCVVLHHVCDYILSKEENFITVLESDPNQRTRPAFEKIRRLSMLKADCGLSLLKYLSLRGSRNTTVPKSIRKYQCLETLVLEDTMVIKLLEKEMCVLQNLRHFSVSSNHIGGVMLLAGNIKALSSIHGLSLIKVKNNRTIIKALGELKHVRNLVLVDLETQDGKELCTALEEMKHLSTLDIRAERLEFLDLDHMRTPPHYLQGLHLEGRLEGLPKWILQLSRLEKIGLHGSELRANVNPLELLQALPYLLELDLVDYYKGEKLIFTAGTFKRLMILKMEQFTELNSISFDDGAMPRLRELTISRCPNLSSLPNGIRGLSSLYKLDLDYMPHKLIQLSAPSDGPAYSCLQFYKEEFSGDVHALPF